MDFQDVFDVIIKAGEHNFKLWRWSYPSLELHKSYLLQMMLWGQHWFSEIKHQKKKKSLQTIITDVCAEPEGQSWEKHSQKTTREKNGGDAGTPQHLHLSLKQLHVIRRIISRLKELIKSIKLIPLIMDLISSDIATKEPSSHKLFVWGTYLDCMKYFMIK